MRDCGGRIFDCFRVHQAGYHNVVALMGDSLSEVQEQLLLGRLPQLVLMLDGDQAGQRASQQLAARLRRKVSLSMVGCGAVGNQTNCRVRKSHGSCVGRTALPEQDDSMQFRFG